VSHPFDLSRRVAVVTGGSGLLGRQHCQCLAALGANVVIADIDGDACQEFARELEQTTAVRALGIACDVSDQGSVQALKERLLASFDGVDVLVNNAAIDDKFENPAGSADESRFENYPLARWQRMLDVNVSGVFLCCQSLGSIMVRRGSGSIINVASTYALVAPDQRLYQQPNGEQAFYKSAAYPTTKAALIGLTRFLAAYWGAAGVRVNALCPGGVANGQAEHFTRAYAARTPLGRMAAPDEYRGAIGFLASDASRYMTGATLVVDGGWTAW
jgi:NAD(P)-dependent dehydrogenase (short-subunit alcohol dehydrogenase family)